MHWRVRRKTAGRANDDMYGRFDAFGRLVDRSHYSVCVFAGDCNGKTEIIIFS